MAVAGDPGAAVPVPARPRRPAGHGLDSTDAPKKSGRLNRIVSWVSIGLVVAAVLKELSQPREDRTWHGRLLGIPYDFRAPTMAKVRERIWAPANPHLLVPHVFGMGWTVNIGRLSTVIASRLSSRPTG